MFALVLIMNEPTLLWLSSLFSGGRLAGALCFHVVCLHSGNMNTHMSFMDIIDFAYFPLGYHHYIEGSLQCRLVSLLADAVIVLYIDF